MIHQLAQAVIILAPYIIVAMLALLALAIVTDIKEALL